MAPAFLTKWSVTPSRGGSARGGGDRHLRLAGVVHGHPKIRDGTEVVTTRIVEHEGRCFISRSGTHYRLKGPPCADFVKFAHLVLFAHGGPVFKAPQAVMLALRAALAREWTNALVHEWNDRSWLPSG